MKEAGMTAEAIVTALECIADDGGTEKSGAARRQAAYRERKKQNAGHNGDVTRYGDPESNTHNETHNGDVTRYAESSRVDNNIYIPKDNNITHTPSLSQNQLAGARAVAVMTGLSEIPDKAGILHRAVADALSADGFEVRCEAGTAQLGDDREGRIDILARRDGGVVAIEIDARKPKARSLKKLMLFNAYRIIALRGVSMAPPAGIDAVVALNVAALDRPELDGFQEFYDAYPRHIARGTAERAWPAAVRKAGGAKVICDAARAFRRKCAGKDENYIPHPATWLNGARWQDEDLRSVVPIRPSVTRVMVFEGSPEWDAWKRTGRRFNAVDLKDDTGRVVGRGWYFESKLPERENAA
jgi:hypothetical protein